MSAFTNAFETLVQERLKAFDSGIDLTAGGPADTLIIQPLLTRLGTDPFEIDIKSFLIQKGKEVFPDIDLITYDDLLINPLTVFLEPFKQQINQIKLAQSISNASSINVEEVQDLMANWFSTIQEGKYTSGTARIYFPAPQACNIGITDRIVSKDNLVFNPNTNYTFLATDLLFNREGTQYFIDITVQAEAVGSKYNIDENNLSYTDIVGSIGVKNLIKFSGGEDGQTNQQFVEATQIGLTERSLNTDKGIRANILDVKALTTIGAGDPAMDRDVLRGGGQGAVYKVGTGLVFGSWAFITNVLLSSPFQTIEIKDEVEVQYALGANTLVAKIHSILWQSNVNVFIELDAALTNGPCTILLKKPGYITLEETPDSIGKTAVPDNTVHVYGHTDVFVRPLSDDKETLAIDYISDTKNTQYLVGAYVGANNNLLAWTDIEPYNIEVGDLVYFDTGNNIGSYTVIQAVPDIRLNVVFNAAEVGIRARIVKMIDINLNQPIVQKLPLKTPVSDLTTFSGSKQVTLLTNTLSYGVIMGDYLEILSGNDKGVYTITGFDAILLGRGLILDRALKYTANNINYKIYSAGAGIALPLITVDDITLLDSNKQETSNKIPYKYPVNIKNTCCIKQGKSTAVNQASLMLLPDLSGIWPLASVPAVPGPGVDARYTQKIATYDGVRRTVSADAANPITTVEINVPPFMWSGNNNKLMAYVTEKDLEFTNDPSGNQTTSPLARANKNFCLNITSSPSVGNYLIKDIRVLELWGKSSAGHQKIALIELYDELPVSPGKAIADFISYVNTIGAGITPITSEEYFKIFDYATDPLNGSGFLRILTTKLREALIYVGLTLTTPEVFSILTNISMCTYKIGPAPRTTLRSYFLNATTAQYYSGIKPTIFKHDDIIARPTNLSANILPNTDVLPTAMLRNGSVAYPVSQAYYSSTGILSTGVQQGDIFKFYPAINELAARDIMTSSFICITQAGSDIVRLAYPDKTANAVYMFNKKPLQAGQFVYIDTGADAGGYIIVEVLSDTFPNHLVRLDKKMTFTTNPYPDGWIDASMIRASFAGGSRVVTMSTGDISTFAAVNKYLTIISAESVNILTAGDDTPYVGTYKITAVDALNKTVTLDRSANFPNNANGYVLIHNAPLELPSDTLNGGKTLTNQYVRFRLYDSILESRTISINWALSPNPLLPSSKSQIILSTPLVTEGYGHKVPYKIVREELSRVMSSVMVNNREAALYYIDTDVFVLNLAKEFDENTVFKIGGRYNIEGYTVKSINKNFSYSTKDIVSLALSPSYIPVGGNEEGRLLLFGKSIKLGYKTSSKVVEIQNQISSPSNRVLCSNTLVRHYLPAYTCIDAKYTGGSSTTVTTADLIEYINNLGSVNKELRVDQLIKVLSRRGASAVVQPITLVALVHDLDRKIQAIESQDSLGTSNPVFNGFNSQIYWIPGVDLTVDTIRADGGGIFLVRS